MKNMGKFRIWFPKVSLLFPGNLTTKVSMEVSIFSHGKLRTVMSMKPRGATGCRYANGGLGALRER